MDTDTHPSELQESSYTFAKNAILVSDAGDGTLKLQNEPSNLLNSVMASGFAVIGNAYDSLTNRIYLFLTNDQTKISEIGYITLGSELELEDEDYVCDCTHKEIVTQKLEEIAQVPSNVYTRLLTDECNGALGFSITNPFREGTIELKKEKCGQVLYFTDNLNPTRRLELDNIAYYQESDEGGTGTITNLGYQVVNTLPDWLHQTTTETGFSYTVDPNLSNTKRTATVVLRQNTSNYETIVVVTQEGIFIPPPVERWVYTFESSVSSVNASNQGETVSLDIQSYRDNQESPYQHQELPITISNIPNWIQYDAQTKELIIEQNNSTAVRQTNLILRQSTSNNILQLSVSQEGAPLNPPAPDPEWRYILIATPELQQCNSRNQQLPYIIQSYRQNINSPEQVEQIPYTTDISVAWLSLDTLRNNISVSENTVAQDRSGRITITQNDSGQTSTIDVSQLALDRVVVSPNPPVDTFVESRLSTINFIFEEGATTQTEFNVLSYRTNTTAPDTQTPIEYRLRAQDNWVTVTNITEDTYMLMPSLNQGDDRKTVLILEQLSGSTAKEVGRYVVYQKGVPFTYTFEILPNTLVFDATGGTKNFYSRTSSKTNSFSPSQVAYAPEAGYPSWVTPTAIGVSVEENTGAYRTATLTYTQAESGKQEQVEIRQQPVVTLRSIRGVAPDSESPDPDHQTQEEQPIQQTFTSNLEKGLRASNLISYYFGATPSNLVFTASDTLSKNVYVTSYQEEFDPDTSRMTCVNVERMRLRPRFSKPCLRAVAISNGGSLKMGMYEYAIAACDKYGNEYSPFYAATMPVAIFNHKDIVMNQTELANPTNMGIMLEVIWEDPRVKYYKVVVCQTASLDGSVSYYEEGIHPIYDKSVVHTDNYSKVATTLQHIMQIPMVYERSRMLTSSNGYLFEGGITVKKALNLQPAALLIGSMCLWQTVKANENLYNDGVAVSEYRTTFRDEVYPYGIRFTGKSGFVSETFVLASRPARARDVEVVNNKNVESIRASEDQCKVNDRLYRYQFENTARVLPDYDTTEPNLVDVGTESITINPECGVEPHEVGEFAYWESTATYPDNEELFNARNLVIEEQDLPNVPYIRSAFEEFFVSGKQGSTYILNDNADFRGKGIRHFRYPDFNTSPFMDLATSFNEGVDVFTDSNIYPIGFYVHEELVKFALTTSLKNGLITQEEYDDIDGFEILRGDRTVHKSVIAKGITFDMYAYTDGDVETDSGGRKVFYPNYPYNDLGTNRLQYDRRGSTTPIEHPFGGQGNNRFTFHSPETHFWNPNLPDELVVEGYQYGKSKGVFNQVREHSRWVIITSQAEGIARTLAIAEVLFDVMGKYGDFMMDLAQMTPQIISSPTGLGIYGAGLTTITSVPGVTFASAYSGSTVGIVGISIAAGSVLGSIGSMYSEAYTKWLKLFRDFGEPINFGYYYTSVGQYNKGVKNLQNGQPTDSYLRYLASAKYVSNAGMVSINENFNREQVRVNAMDRESFVYLSTGQDEDLKINYIPEVQNVDNSRITAGDVNYNGNNDHEVIREILSPYVSLKQYNPSQYSTVNSIKWLPTGHCGIFGRKTHHRIFGGDVYISRFALKRKVPFWYSTAFRIADRVPFNYTQYDNIGQNVFWANYDTSDIDELDTSNIGGAILALVGINAPTPKWRSEYNFDTYNESGNYVRNYSKMYLYYYGIPSFLVESEINCNYRYAGTRPEEGFYPQIGDYVEWTQQAVVDIRQDNQYKYNNVYSRNARLSNGGMLPATYEKEAFDCRYDMPNGVIYSMQDTSEQDLADPWSVFRPLDFYQFPTSYGRLMRLKGIESSQVMGLFENQAVLYNAIDELRDRTQSTTRELGTGGIFARRPIEFFMSDLGYSGTQHSTLLSTSYGHYYVDCKRGTIIKVNPNGQGMQAITAGKTRWFKKHLPFKILKGGIRGLTDLDMDNSYNHLGISLGWDNKYDRIILTKLDYRVRSNWRNKLMFEDGRFYQINDEGLRGEEVSITDRSIFENASFTMSYSPVQERWTAYHSYTPNFIVSNVEAFSSGFNLGNENGIADTSIWEHNQTEQSFSVFQGRLYPFELEYPTTNTGYNNEMSSIAYWLDCRRYKDHVNYAALTKIGFDQAFAYNETENTGVMNLVVEQSNNRRQYIEYPKYVGNALQILISNREKEWNLNSLFNRIRKENVNVPQMVTDLNEIDSEPNPEVIDRSLRKKDRLKGNWFKVRLRANKSSYKLITHFFRTALQNP